MSAVSAAGAVQKPTKGVRPRLEGVPGVLLTARDVAPLGLIFGAATRVSPYDAKLRELCAAEAGAVLCFGNLRARASLYQRAKKLNIKLEFGEQGGKLYARLVSSEALPRQSVTGTVVTDAKTRNRALICAAIRKGKKTPEAIAAFLRDEGHTNFDGPVVRSMLKHMQAQGQVTLMKITPETWEVKD